MLRENGQLSPVGQQGFLEKPTLSWAGGTSSMGESRRGSEGTEAQGCRFGKGVGGTTTPKRWVSSVSSPGLHISQTWSLISPLPCTGTISQCDEQAMPSSHMENVGINLASPALKPGFCYYFQMIVFHDKNTMFLTLFRLNAFQSRQAA